VFTVSALLMNRHLSTVLALLLFAAGNVSAEPAKLVPKPRVFPLQLDDAITFRKTKIFINDPVLFKQSQDDMLTFERQHVNFGAITQYDRQQRFGSYYTFFWRATRRADVTVRFEYRQEKLGSYVQAQERTYPAAKGNFESKFAVIGDDYNNEGKVTSWRAIIIEDGKIVALNQSFLWR
jgi:hypothetical protein